MTLVIVINRLIDPFGFYEQPRIDNFNKEKPAFEKNIRMTKAFAIKDKKPDAIILGSSKAEFGFDPEHKYLDKRNFYNLGLPGPNLYEVYRYFQHAHNIKKQKKILLFLDFYMFNANLPNKVDFDERMLSISFNGNQQHTAGNKLALLSSWHALKGSYETIKLQNSVHYKYLKNGMRERNHMKDRILLEGGHKKIFLKKEKNLINKFYKDYSFFNKNINSWNIFEKLLNKSYESDIDLTIVIQPMHARHLSTISISNNWQKYERWKRGLIASNDKVSKKYKKNKFDIWDFALLNDITMEQVPSLNDKDKQMRWWWDSHFKAEFGDIIISLIHNYDQKKFLFKKPLGKRIDQNNIDYHLKSLNSDLNNWKSKFKNDQNELESLIN